jgi:mRNA (guanine-N7-)-methyltransferase
LAAEYGLYPTYKEEFHQVFDEHQSKDEFRQLMVRMKVINSEGESSMSEDEWEAASTSDYFPPSSNTSSFI